MYSDESSEPVFHTKGQVPLDRMVCKTASKVRGEINASPMPNLPYVMSEFNASWKNKPEVTDTVFMGPWLADTVRQCDGSVDMMSFWSFSDVFEEEGVVKKPFYGGFGMIAEDNIPKPAFNAFALLHKLGGTRLKTDSESALITRRKDGTLVIALWNYAPPKADESRPGSAKTFELTLNGVSAHAQAAISRLDATHGNVLKEFDAMGRPDFPTQEQIARLQTASKLAPAVRLPIRNGRLTVAVPVHGLALLEIR
jgi:xylan 1,4-beta-xylosidase